MLHNRHWSKFDGAILSVELQSFKNMGTFTFFVDDLIELSGPKIEEYDK